MLCDISNPLDNNNQGRCLLDICDSYDLDSLNNTPTKISSQRSSCLDVISRRMFQVISRNQEFWRLASVIIA